MRRIPFATTVLLVTTVPALAAQVGSMRVTVPSPTAATLGKCGDIPVSLYTGVPDISIPLFTAKGRTIDLPIVLKYHAGGIRVEEIGGWAGIGWTLEAGGSITRTVRGVVDEQGAGYYNTGHTFWEGTNWPNPPTTLLDNVRNELVDGEPDQFFFTLAGRAGRFVMGPTSTSDTIKEYRTIPVEKLAIAPTISGGQIQSWVITTEGGTKYTFAAAETTTDYSLSFTPQLPTHYAEEHKSTWHLTEVRSPSGDVITLHYTPCTVRHRFGLYRETFDEVLSLDPNCVPAEAGTTNEYETVVQRLDSIKAAAHTVIFTVDGTLRNDARSPSNLPQEPRLQTITVRTPSGALLKAFDLAHHYFSGNRLRLINLFERGSSGRLVAPLHVCL